MGDNEALFFTADSSQDTRSCVEGMMLRVPLPVALAFREHTVRTDFHPDLRSITVPALILHGASDASPRCH